MSRIDDAAMAFQQGRVMSGAVHKANCERDHYKEQYEIIEQKWIDYKDRCAELERADAGYRESYNKMVATIANLKQIIADAPHDINCGTRKIYRYATGEACDCWKAQAGSEQ